MDVTVVDDIRQRVDRRLSELEPMVAEYQKLLAVREGLADDAPSGRARSVRRGNQSSTSRRRPTRGTGKQAAKPGRAEQALSLIGDQPGITVKEIAQHMQINDNYLYRLLPRMEKEGQITRKDKGWALKQR